LDLEALYVTAFRFVLTTMTLALSHWAI